MNAWNVYLEYDNKIDTVFYDSDCGAQYVYQSLVDHDGYDSTIYVELENSDVRYPEQQ